MTAATGTGSPRLVASAVIVGGTLVACLRVTVGARLTGAFLALEVGTLGAVSLLGFQHAVRPLQEAVATGPPAPHLTIVFCLAVAAQLPTAVFAYNGYASGVFLTEDMTRPSSTVPTMIYTSLALVLVVELTPLAAILVGAPSIEAMAANSSPIAYFVRSRGGPGAASWLLPAIALVIANAVVAIVMQASRLLFTAARDGALAGPVSRPFSQLDPRTGAPARAALLVGLLSMVALALVPPGTLLTLTASTILVAGAAVAICSLVGRPRGVTGVGSYRMPCWPLPPLVTLGTTVGIGLAQWRADEARILAPLAVFVAAFVVGVVRQQGQVTPPE